MRTQQSQKVQRNNLTDERNNKDHNVCNGINCAGLAGCHFRPLTGPGRATDSVLQWETTRKSITLPAPLLPLSPPWSLTSLAYQTLHTDVTVGVVIHKEAATKKKPHCVLRNPRVLDEVHSECLCVWLCLQREGERKSNVKAGSCGSLFKFDQKWSGKTQQLLVPNGQNVSQKQLFSDLLKGKFILKNV